MIIISSCWYCEDTLTSGNHQSVWLIRITMSHQKNFILTSCWLYKTLFLTLLGWCGFFNQFRGLESCELTMLVDNFVWRHENWWSVPGYNEGTEIFCHHIVFQTSPHSPARLSDCTAMMTRSHNHVIKFLIIENNNNSIYFLFLDTLIFIWTHISTLMRRFISTLIDPDPHRWSGLCVKCNKTGLIQSSAANDFNLGCQTSDAASS